MAFGYDAVILQLEAAYEAGTGDSVPFISGELAKHEHGHEVPRVVFLFRSGTHEDPAKAEGYQNARVVDGFASIAIETLRAECYADSDEGADTLWEQVCTLLKSEFGETVELGAIGWITQDERVASQVLTTSLKWQDFRFKRGVKRHLRTPTTARAETTDHLVFLTPDATDGCEHDTPDVPWVDP